MTAPSEAVPDMEMRKPMTVGQLKQALANMPDELEITVRVNVEVLSAHGPLDVSLIGDMGTVAVDHDHTDDKPFCAVDFHDGDLCSEVEG